MPWASAWRHQNGSNHESTMPDFAFLLGTSLIAEYTKQLEAFMRRHQLKRIGEPVIAFYDDPFTLPWNRRSEISAEVEYPEEKIQPWRVY